MKLYKDTRKFILLMVLLTLANTRWCSCLKPSSNIQEKKGMFLTHAHLTARVKWHVSILLLHHGHHRTGVHGPPFHQEAGMWGCRLDVTMDSLLSWVKSVAPRLGATQEVDHLCLTAKPRMHKWTHPAMSILNMQCTCTMVLDYTGRLGPW